MPPLLIGMVVVGFGTSAPEMVVSLLAALEGKPALALGNALRFQHHQYRPDPGVGRADQSNSRSFSGDPQGASHTQTITLFSGLLILTGSSHAWMRCYSCPFLPD